jgi:small neutral amino acid transporter SnatA (MarC family)
MEDRDLQHEISEQEERLEELTQSLERCRKIILVSKVSMILGGMLILATLLGLLSFDPLALIVATTAIIGGIVLFGSTTTTTKQTSAAMKDTEALRAQLISRLELRTVGD